MNDKNLISIIRSLEDKKESFVFHNDDKEIKKLISGDKFQDKMRRFFSRDRIRRVELFKKGTIVLSRVYRCQQYDIESPNSYKALVLFSPSLDISLHPEMLDEVFENLMKYEEECETRKLNFKERKFFMALTSYEEEPMYFQVPVDISLGLLVYMSHVFISPKTVSDFYEIPKYLPVIMNKKISREIIPLPNSLYSDEFVDFLKS